MRYSLTDGNSLTDGTAEVELDYKPGPGYNSFLGGGVIYFAPGKTSAVISVILIDDTVTDDHKEETFTVTLSSPANATIGDGEAIGTIIDNEKD